MAIRMTPEKFLAEMARPRRPVSEPRFVKQLDLRATGSVSTRTQSLGQPICTSDLAIGVNVSEGPGFANHAASPYDLYAP